MSHERQRSNELSSELLEGYRATFINRQDKYPLQLPQGTYVSIPKPLTYELIAAHLLGHVTIGTYALDPKGWSKWVCLDADSPELWQGLLGIARRLAKEEVTAYLEESRRGGHLWLFTDPIPGFQIRRAAKQLLAEQALNGIEIYPKQDRPVTGPGSLVRLPLGIHRITSKRYHFITLDGEPLAPSIREQAKKFAEPRKVPIGFVDEVLSRAPQHKAVSPTPAFEHVNRETLGKPSERIKAAIPVFDFVRQFVELDGRGKGYCPFHDDAHKSFQVNQSSNYWNCYAGCGGGSVIDFWQKWRGAHNQDDSFVATITDLAEMLL